MLTRNYKLGIMVAMIMFLIIVIIVVPTSLVASWVTSDKIRSNTIVNKKSFKLDEIPTEELNRINCFLEGESRFENLTRYQCEGVRSCTFRPSEYERVPDCFFKRELLGYELVDAASTDNTETYRLRRSTKGNATYLEPVDNLVMTVEFLGDNVVHVKIEDADDPGRYQVPYGLNAPARIDLKAKSKARFSYSVDSNKLFQWKVTRGADAEILFDTSMGAFVYHNQFIQISTRLSSPYVYGFGENNHEQLVHDLNFRSWGIFARDFAPGWGVRRGSGNVFLLDLNHFFSKG